jgi:TatD DNase family protein
VTDVTILNYVDTHCHLNFDEFNLDRDEVVSTARRIGVSRILIPGINISTSKTAVDFTRLYPEVYAAVGIHPNESANWSKNSISAIRDIAVDRKVVAIGEIGLDYYRDRSPKETQKTIFLSQLDLAAEFGLPVIIHNRNASEDIFKIIQEWHSSLMKSGLELAKSPGVFHSFSGEISFANDVLSLNFKIGVDGPITFLNAKNLQSIISTLQLDNILIETDAPYLSPHPHRGKRNEPSNVRLIAQKIAEIMNVSLENVIKITTTSADKLFRWREIP